MKQYQVLGIMSGSSLDGLDICHATFSEQSGNWQFQIKKAATHPLPAMLAEELRAAPGLSSINLDRLDHNYGKWIGEEILNFIAGSKENFDLVAVHGHTVFHEPKQGISKQLGVGKVIARTCGLPVVDDFRIEDIRKGGQGAPLVPVGEHYLFPNFDACVNLGGIANLSVKRNNQILAWDICPCNQVLNHFANQLGLPYDKGGHLAKAGGFNELWFQSLKSLDYFGFEPPKSLSNQWGVQNILQTCDIDPRDGLCTYTNLIADLICRDLLRGANTKMQVLFTGGGAHNSYLMDCIKKKSGDRLQVILPEKEIIEFKEALIFGLLGLLRMLNRINVFASVTGATSDSVAGTIHYPE